VDHSVSLFTSCRRLCVFGGFCVDMWRLVHQWSFFCCFYCFLTVFDCFWRLGHCTNRQKQSKPLVCQSSQVYQDCTNSVPIVKTSQKQSKDSQNSKNDHWCTNRHMTTQSPPNTQSRVRHFPSTTTIRQSIIWSDLSLTCTKLIAVDRLGSGIGYRLVPVFKKNSVTPPTAKSWLSVVRRVCDNRVYTL